MAKSKGPRIKMFQSKKFRRQWLTSLRMVRYGANNFTRNIWLTTAATAVMTITLLIVFTTVIARDVLSATVTELRQKVDVSVYLKSDISTKDAASLRQTTLSDANVTGVRYIPSEQAKKDYIATEVGGNDIDQLQTLSELDINTFPAEFRIAVKDPDQLASLETLVKNDKGFQEFMNPDLAPTFAGDRRTVIDTISGWAKTAERVGLIASTVFVAISMLIVFNTIRMAIFSRKEEIQMMKLIGADKNFIRGPFVVEAVMYGFIAALLATSLGYFGLLALEPKIASYGVAIGAIKDDLVLYAPLILVSMIVIGSMIGVISSRLAVRRYLKV
ncbi:ABC transporter permease [Pedobacter sp.]|nr:ABC transporter permease [Candidatus Saccharibacteria bacterium]